MAVSALAGLTARQALGQYSSNKSQAAASTQNAQVAEANAATVRGQAAAQADADARTNRRRLGQAAADVAANGGDPNSGSSLDVMLDQASEGELNRRLTLYRGAVAATGYTNQANAQRYSATLSKQAAITQPIMTVLGGAAKGIMNGYFDSTPPKTYSGAGSNTPGGLRAGGWDYS